LQLCRTRTDISGPTEQLSVRNPYQSDEPKIEQTNTPSCGKSASISPGSRHAFAHILTTGRFRHGRFRAFSKGLHRFPGSCRHVLPLSVTSEGAGYSPYSSWSAFAGNTMFIDPWELVSTGLLDSRKLKKRRVRSGTRGRFSEAAASKKSCLEEAFKNFCRYPPKELEEEYRTFVDKEQAWLDDFALYALLQQHFGFRPWHTWPRAFRDRDLPALKAFSQQHEKPVYLQQTMA